MPFKFNPLTGSIDAVNSRSEDATFSQNIELSKGKKVRFLDGGVQKGYIELDNASTISHWCASGHEQQFYAGGNINLTLGSGTATFAGKLEVTGNIEARGSTDVKLYLGSTGDTTANNNVHLRADLGHLKLNSADGKNIYFEENGNTLLTIENNSGNATFAGNVIVSEPNTLNWNASAPGATTTLKVQNNSNNDNNATGIELRVQKGNGAAGMHYITNTATGTDYKSNLIFSRRTGSGASDYAQTLTLGHDGKATFAGDISYPKATPDGEITVTISGSALADGAYITVIPAGTTGIVDAATYIVSINWDYASGTSAAPWNVTGGTVWVPKASNDNVPVGGDTGHEVQLLSSFHADQGSNTNYYLKVRSITGSGVQSGLQVAAVGWSPWVNSEFRIKYKRIM